MTKMNSLILKLLKKGLVLSLVLVVALTGCSNKVTSKKKTEKKVVYATFFPVYDLTKRIVGDKMEVKTIMSGGDEPHSFELKSKAMIDISKADLIVYNGAGMESFIGALKDVTKDENKFLNISQGLALLSSEKTHGNSDNKEVSAKEVESDTNINPHTWLSVKNAMIQLDTIYRKVSSMDPENEAYYKENLEKSLKEFKALDEEFVKVLSNVKRKDKYFVTAHSAFNYLAHDYGLKQVAVTGVSPDQEPSAKVLAEITDFVKKHKITTIFFDGKATPKVAKTLARETGAKTETMYTLESLTDDEIKLGYLNIMKHNLEVLAKSLNE